MQNRLAHERSPYLRQHASNPVDWYPWGEEALGRARAEDRPILLSVGYAACHWCHVMAHESFEHEGAARLMNEGFVNVKVDREERADLDQLYQGVVQLMGRGGGWPLTVFLTPELRPFYGGTYFPREARYGMPGFLDLLRGLTDAWRSRRDEVEHQAKGFEDGLTQLTRMGLGGEPEGLEPQHVGEAALALHRESDRRFGGFGGAPKFPNPMGVALLLRGFRRTGDARLKDAALFAMRRMAEGGIYDQLGGGFHRYATDERWLVPHFEKMLYDNAQLLHLAAEVQQLAPDPLWARVMDETVDFLAREMTHPEGAFFATQDADTEGEEGRFFVWTPGQVREVLGDETLTRRFCLRFGVTEEGNFEHGRSVLSLVTPLPELAAREGVPEEALREALDGARTKLLQARARRAAPARDEKILSGWNGLMIRGLAFAGRVVGRSDFTERARRAADFVLEHLRVEGRLLRVWQEGEARLDGLLEDHGDLAAGLCALYQATFEPRYLEQAEAIVDAAHERFWDEGAGAYLSAPRGTADLLVPPYALHDNAVPSGASTLTEAQVALAALTGRARHLERAERYLSSVGKELRRHPFAYAHLWLAADAFLDGAPSLLVLGKGAARSGLVGVASKGYAPTVHVAAAEPGETEAAHALAEVLEGRKPGPKGAPRAYLCRHFTCEAPADTDEALIERMGGLLAATNPAP